MPRPTFYDKRGDNRGLTQAFGFLGSFKSLASMLKTLIISCLCVEKCRFCGREIALATHCSPVLERDLLADIDKSRLDENLDSDLFDEKLTNSNDKEFRTRKISEPGESAPAVVPDKLPASFFKMLAEPTRAISNELKELSLATTHAKLVPPALIYFAKHPGLSPRLSECLCNLCWDEIEVDLPLLGFCPLPHLEQQSLPVASGVAYHGKAKELIRAFKYEGDATLAADLASLMSIGWSALTDYMPAREIVLIPVPLHKERKQTRGYNQAELLAKELGKIVSAPVAPRALQRMKATKSQQVLGRIERLENVRHAFTGDRRQLENRTVVLVDDVCTSGSTLVACAEEVLNCGARSVVALTVARALLNQDR